MDTMTESGTKQARIVPAIWPTQATQEFYRPTETGFRPQEKAALRKKTLIVGFSGRARSGKNTCVEHLMRCTTDVCADVCAYSFAEALKIEVFDYLQAWGFIYNNEYESCSCPSSEINYSPEEKVAWIEANKQKFRSLLQRWGTEYRRTQASNYWVNKTLEQIQRDNPRFALISDCRFKNETSICDVVVRVIREGYIESDLSVGAHISETELDNYPFDHTISVKDGDLTGLKTRAEEVFREIVASR